MVHVHRWRNLVCEIYTEGARIDSGRSAAGMHCEENVGLDIAWNQFEHRPVWCSSLALGCIEQRTAERSTCRSRACFSSH